jgi:transposase
MRRFASVTSATALTALASGTFAAIAPHAEAATTWTTKGAYKNVKAGGTYTRTSHSVTVKGWIRDYKKNGWAAAVQFKATERGKNDDRSAVYFFLDVKTPADLHYTETYGRFFTSKNTTHLYVRECGVTPVKSVKRRTTKCADWQKIY